MRISDLQRFAALAGCVIMGLSATGCSVVGYGAGAVIDHSRPDKEYLDGWQIGKIETGREMIVHLKDGSSAAGKYEGLVALPDSDYAANYSLFQSAESPPLILPPLGDTVKIKVKQQPEREYRFRCFIYKYDGTAHTMESSQGAKYQFILAESIAGGVLEQICLIDLDRIETGEGMMGKGDLIGELAEHGKIPLKTAALVKSSFDGGRLFPVNSIAKVETTRIKNAKITGLKMGLVVDILAAAGLIYFAATLYDGEWEFSKRR